MQQRVSNKVTTKPQRNGRNGNKKRVRNENKGKRNGNCRTERNVLGNAYNQTTQSQTTEEFSEPGTRSCNVERSGNGTKRGTTVIRRQNVERVSVQAEQRKSNERNRVNAVTVRQNQ